MSTISVIVPVYNGAATLGAALRSARAQTHCELQIIVIDDGSTDDSLEIARHIAALDRRVEVIATSNRGVATARNTGLARATGAYVAPLDADDLWHPSKLELQLAALKQAGPDAVLTYSWFAPIDAGGCISRIPKMPEVEGPVFYRHLDYNFIANGSSALIRGDAMRAVGYDPAFSHAEDYKLQLELALRGTFVCTRAVLTGYRKVGTGLSSEVENMLTAHIALMDAMRSPRRPFADAVIDQRIAEFEIELVRNRLRRKHFGEGAAALMRGLKRSPKAALNRIGIEARQALSRGRESNPTFGSPVGEKFPLSNPHARVAQPIPDHHHKRLASLALLDARADYQS